MGRFAVDKYSLYFDGQRTESNSGASRVDLATLKAIEGNSTTLMDSKISTCPVDVRGAAVMLLY